MKPGLFFNSLLHKAAPVAAPRCSKLTDAAAVTPPREGLENFFFAKKLTDASSGRIGGWVGARAAKLARARGACGASGRRGGKGLAGRTWRPGRTLAKL